MEIMYPSLEVKVLNLCIMPSHGLLFVCDNGNHWIQVFQNDQFSYSFGEYGTYASTFNYPKDVILNSSEDQLFIAIIKSKCMFTTNGWYLQSFGNLTGVHRHLNYESVGVYYTPNRYLLVSYWNSHCALVFEDNEQFISAIEGTDW